MGHTSGRWCTRTRPTPYTACMRSADLYDRHWRRPTCTPACRNSHFLWVGIGHSRPSLPQGRFHSDGGAIPHMVDVLLHRFERCWAELLLRVAGPAALSP